MKPRGRIFICYRHAGGSEIAFTAYEKLRNCGFDLFMDRRDLKGGKFKEALLDKVEWATDLLVILSPGSLDRCGLENDFFSLEIAHAIDCEKNIVPVMANGFKWPQDPMLNAIERLREYNGIEGQIFFDATCKDIREYFVGRPSRWLKSRRLLIVGMCVGLLLALALWNRGRVPSPPPLFVLAESDFEIDTEGWQGTNTSQGSELLTYYKSGANSTGYISVGEDRGDSATNYFAAPSKYLGNRRLAYNGEITFTLKQLHDYYLDDAGNCVLLGSTNILLSYGLRTLPGTKWQKHRIVLNENTGWYNLTSDRPATKQELMAVLNALNRFWIRAEFSKHGIDRGDLDDVVLWGRELVTKRRQRLFGCRSNSLSPIP